MSKLTTQPLGLFKLPFHIRRQKACDRPGNGVGGGPLALGGTMAGSGKMALAAAHLILEFFKLTESALGDSTRILWAWSE